MFGVQEPTASEVSIIAGMGVADMRCVVGWVPLALGSLESVRMCCCIVMPTTIFTDAVCNEL